MTHQGSVNVNSGKMSRHKAVNFIRHLVILILVALAPLATVVHLQSTAAPPELDAEAERVAGEIDRLLQLRMRQTFALAALPSLRGFAAADPSTRSQRGAVASNELHAWLAADPPVREVFIVDRQGHTLLTTGEDWQGDWSARAFIKNSLAGELDVSPPSRDVGEFSQYYSAPILDNGGNVAGALVARIAAQELWQVVRAASVGDDRAIVLSDENGVRLADGGDPARNLVAWAALTTEQQTRVVKEQTYGSQVAILPATNFRHAAQTLTAGSPDTLAPGDVGASKVGARRLTSKPWTVVVLSSSPTWMRTFSNLAVPLFAAIGGALLAAFLLTR